MPEQEAAKPPQEIPRLTDDEIKELARDIVEDKVFTSGMCPQEMLGMVFMPYGLGGMNNMDLANVGAIVEHYAKAGERGINGYPMFMSCRVIHKDDWTKVGEKALAIDAAIKAAME
jgi:hypothetical protein